MFSCGDLVLYGIHGVCKIVNQEIHNISKKRIEYYILEPLDQPGTRYLVPTENKAAVSKLRPIITPEELDVLLRSEDANADVWITDENQRKQRYKDLITCGDRVALICMVRTLHKHKLQQQEVGRKFHQCDENFLRDAEKLLSAEFSIVLGIPQDKVAEYVQNISLVK